MDSSLARLRDNREVMNALEGPMMRMQKIRIQLAPIDDPALLAGESGSSAYLRPGVS